MNDFGLGDVIKLQKLADILIEFGVNYSFQLFGALIVLIVGIFIAVFVSKFALKLCEKHNVDVTLRNFIAGIVRLIILGFVIIISLGKIGITVTPFIAAIGALTFGAGLAIQGLLSNYGAGITIIITRPFIVGNTIRVLGVSGVVTEIKLSWTILTNEDDEVITIPNKHIIGEILHNSFENRIAEATIGIDYSSSPEKAIEVIKAVLAEFSEIGGSPGAQVGIEEFGDSSINIGVRYWVPTQKFHQTQYKVNLAVFNALLEAGISIPYPRRDITILKGESVV